jgi:hypothetical protein
MNRADVRLKFTNYREKERQTITLAGDKTALVPFVNANSRISFLDRVGLIGGSLRSDVIQ